MTNLFRTFLLALLPIVGFAAAPCVTSTVDCTEWVALGRGRSLVYRNLSLTTPNPAITRALIVIHGAGRNADHYFQTAVASAFLAGGLNDTLVISPRFASNDGSCLDKLDTEEVSWSCNGDSWRSGGKSVSHPALTSYDFADELLKAVAKKSLFPNLKSIVVTGHSAGGQFVTRYQMANKVHDTLGVPVTYVVSNPSSYAYLDAARPNGETFRNFSDARNCTTFDNWPYGLQNRSGYVAEVADDVLKTQLAARPLVYLLGEIDILPLGGFDGSCPAMAQGPTRLARGQNFAKYAAEKFGAKHPVTVVHLCGHNDRCMFTSEEALPILFPKF